MRKAFVAEALASTRQLTEILGQLTEAEIAHVIELEEATQRRDTILNKLYRELRQRARKLYQRSTSK